MPARKIKLASKEATGHIPRHTQSNPMNATDIESNEYKKQFLHEATRLAIESVEKGWGGPF
jgi:hypothetical protein